MASPRKTTGLLAWWPAQGSPGQRHAGAALARAFADVSAQHRVGKVREALADVAARAEAAYAERMARKGEPIGEPTSKPTASKAPTSKRKASKASAARKAAADALAYRCGACNAEIGAGKRSTHEATARHRRNVAADA